METNTENVLESPPHRTDSVSGLASPRNRVILAIVIAVAVFASWSGYGWWFERRSDQFKQGCDEANAAEDWERLRLISGEWRKWDSTSDDALVFQADAFFQTGRLREAADLLAQVDDSYSGAVAALLYCGEILFGDLNEPFEAERIWKRVLKIKPDSTHTHQRLMYLYAITLQRSKLIDQIRDAFQQQSEPPEAYSYYLLANSLEFTDGFLVMTKWRANEPDSEILEVAEAIYAGRSKDLRDPDDSANEVEYFMAPGDQRRINTCLDKYPSNIEVLSYHIERSMFGEDAARVTELLGAAPEVALEDARFWRYRGWVLKQLGNYEEATAALEKSIEIDQFSWKARWDLAAVQRLAGKLKAAEETSELAIRGKRLEEALFLTDGRNISWNIIFKMHEYIELLDAPDVLNSLERRIRLQGGNRVAN